MGVGGVWRSPELNGPIPIPLLAIPLPSLHLLHLLPLEPVDTHRDLFCGSRTKKIDTNKG